MEGNVFQRNFGCWFGGDVTLIDTTWGALV